MARFFTDYYFLILLLVAGGGYLAARLVLARRTPESGAPSFDYRDPYLIAALRGGPDATIELAMVALLDRGLLNSDNAVFDETASVRATREDAADFARNEVERELLRAARQPVGVREVVIGAAVKTAANLYVERLEKLGLKGSRADRRQRRRIVANCFLPALLVVLVRIVVGPKAWLFAVVVGAFVIGPAIYFALRRTEGPGEAMLRELGDLFAGLAGRASDLRRGRMSSDAMFCGATFGLWCLPEAEYPAAAFYSKEERRRRQSESDSTSSCGSGGCGSSCSSGCGSSDGGGGGDGGSSCGGGCGGGCS